MDNERNYASLMPTEPPEELFRFLQEKEDSFQRGVLAFKFIGLAEADARMDCEDLVADFRPEWEREKGHKTALLWCSECGREMLAEYIKDEGCTRYGGPPAGIRLKREPFLNGGRREFMENSELKCPYCRKDVRLKRSGDLTHGLSEQVLAAAMTVADGLPVLTEWCVERVTRWKRQETFFSPLFGYIVDGKKIVRMAQYRRSFGGVFSFLGSWEERKRATDMLGAPTFYNELPCLDGTSLENAKLPEYYAQAYETGSFYPIGYIRLYQKHPNIENLITAGMGKLVGEVIGREVRSTSYYGTGKFTIPKLRWIQWKEARPAQMLGLTREQLRQARADGWGAEELEFWNKAAGQMKFAEAAEAVKLAGAKTARQMLADGAEPLRTARYLKKQGESYTFLQDYRRMAREAGQDLREEIVFWPPHLRDAHDRADAAARYKENAKDRESFARMSARCTRLCWERNGICIRPALEPEELVAEGKTLHHCVGGYAKSHAAGQIILFIRHTRRPERSWFTLNVDVNTKQVIQLHGYGNERSPKGERLRIPSVVKEFVALWEEQVLKPWKLPPEKKRKAGEKAEAETGPPGCLTQKIFAINCRKRGTEWNTN